MKNSVSVRIGAQSCACSLGFAGLTRRAGRCPRCDSCRKEHRIVCSLATHHRVDVIDSSRKGCGSDKDVAIVSYCLGLGQVRI